MQVIFLGTFSRDLDEITDSDLKDSIREVIRELETSSSVRSISNVKKMTGYKNAYRVRIRDYRLGFYYENDIIELASFQHRSKIYRVFP